MKKRILVMVVVSVIIALIVTPTVLLISSLGNDVDMEEILKLQELQIDFVGRYGTEAQILNLFEPENFYMIEWEENNMYYLDLYIDGWFARLHQAEINQEGGNE